MPCGYRGAQSIGTPHDRTLLCGARHLNHAEGGRLVAMEGSILSGAALIKTLPRQEWF